MESLGHADLGFELQLCKKMLRTNLLESAGIIACMTVQDDMRYNNYG